jgi:hypothetical protein
MTDTEVCADWSDHPAHSWFPAGDYPDGGRRCPGRPSLASAIENPRPKRVNGQAKGKRGELDVVNYLKPWFPDARRTVRTGFRNAKTSAADEGDIDGTPGLCLQVKVLGTELVSGKVLQDIYADTTEQASGRMPLIVNKRNGRGEVGQWWVWLTVGDLVQLKSGMPRYMVNGGLTLVRVPMFNIISDLKSFSDRLATP